jgi:hypothetical protein
MLKEFYLYDPLNAYPVQTESLEEMMAFVDETTKAFLIYCIRAKITEKFSAHYSPESWERNLILLFQYFMTEESQPSLAAKQSIPVTRQNINLSIKSTIKNLWKNCPEEVRQKYQLKELRTKKSSALHTLQQHQNTANEMAALKKIGLSPKKAAKKMGETRTTLQGRRAWLKRKGIQLLDLNIYLGEKHKENWEKSLLEAKSDREVQKLLNQVTFSIYKKYFKDSDGPIISLKTVYSYLEYFNVKKTGKLAKVLKKAGVPVGKIVYEVKEGQEILRYYFIATKDLERSRQVLVTAPELEDARVRPLVQLYGPPQEELPSVFSLLTKKELFGGVRTLLRSEGVHLRARRSSDTTENFLDENCPVPIYKFRSTFSYPKEQEEALREYVRKRKVEWEKKKRK